jgi:hypothetical protein
MEKSPIKLIFFELELLVQVPFFEILWGSQGDISRGNMEFSINPLVTLL